jgi:hypothetical protein
MFFIYDQALKKKKLPPELKTADDIAENFFENESLSQFHA